MAVRWAWESADSHICGLGRRAEQRTRVLHVPPQTPVALRSPKGVGSQGQGSHNMGEGLIGIHWAHSLVKTLVTSMYYVSHPQGLCGKGFRESLKKTGQLLLVRKCKERENPDVCDGHYHFAHDPWPCSCVWGMTSPLFLSILHLRKLRLR